MHLQPPYSYSEAQRAKALQQLRWVEASLCRGAALARLKALLMQQPGRVLQRLGQLTGLRHLDLDDSAWALGGATPTDYCFVSRLTALTHLGLRGHNMTSRVVKRSAIKGRQDQQSSRLQAALGALRQLQFLDLRDTGFKQVPEVLSGRQGLQCLVGWQ